MKCAVIGTSNSLMKQNYLRALRKISDVTVFDNFSVGGTPNILLPYVLSQQDMSPYGMALLETSVNDLWLIRSGKIAAERVARYLLDAVRFLKDRGIRPVILILPVNADVPEIAALRRMLRKIAAAQKVTLVDGYSVLEAVTAISSPGEKDLFTDASHITADLAAIIACRVHSAMERQGGRVQPSEKPGKYPYSFLPARADDPVVRKNSMFHKTYARLTAGQTLDFDFKSRQELIGFAVNVTGCAALVEVTIDGGEKDGGEKRILDFRLANDPENAGLAFFHSLKPNPQPFTARRVSLRVCRTDEEPQDILAVPRSGNGKQNAGAVEIEGLILRDGTKIGAMTPDTDETAFPPEVLTRAERLLAEKLAMPHPNPGAAKKPLVVDMFPPDRDLAADRRADLLRDIGRMLIDAGEPVAALKVLSEAATERPAGGYIKTLLQEASSLKDRSAN